MLNFSFRDKRLELLDNDEIPFDDIKQNLSELNVINTFLGGHRITIQGLKFLLTKSSEPIHIVEIGCGGGDNLRVIASCLEKKGIQFRLTGIDIKRECVEYARQQNPTFEFICADYEKVAFSEKPSIIFSSLFCHHFYDAKLDQVIQWMNQHSKIGFFVNDLHRHFMAYHSIKWLTKLFSKSYLVKHDAPLSVARGFIYEEWVSIMEQNLITSYSIQWKWAFRYLICVRHGRK